MMTPTELKNLRDKRKEYKRILLEDVLTDEQETHWRKLFDECEKKIFIHNWDHADLS